MRYKLVPAMLHNLGHSFMGRTANAIVGQGRRSAFIVDLLPDALASSPRKRLQIRFPSHRIEPAGAYRKEVLESVRNYAGWMPEFMESNGIAPGAVPEIVLVISECPSGPRCRVKGHG